MAAGCAGGQNGENIKKYPFWQRLYLIFKDEMAPTEPGAIHFKLGDLGVSKLFEELDAASTLKEGIRPPEAG